jgi:hypothetical protein
MSIAYRILPERALAVVWLAGDVTLLEILTSGAQMFGEPAWQPGFRILCDYRRASHVLGDHEQIRQLVAQDRDNDARLRGTLCAVVAEKDHVFGLARMWEMLSEGSAFEACTFRVYAEALAWLELEPADVPEPPPG